MNEKQLIAKLEEMITDRERFSDMLKDFEVCLGPGVSDLEYSQMSLSALVKISQLHTIDLKYVVDKIKEHFGVEE